jgi:hypothetical protein
MNAINKFRINFKLRQHTPIIHFQHDHYGATLRATEVKPKLDRFLCEKMPSIPALKEHAHLADKVRRAIDNKQSLYKMAFEAPSGRSLSLPIARSYYGAKAGAVKERIGRETAMLDHSPYFANEDKIKFKSDEIKEFKADELRYGLKADELISATIFSFDKKLLACIQEALPFFFAYENFGNRQNKGFGCFEVESINQERINQTNAELLTDVYSTVYEKAIKGKWYEEIQKDYKLLKAGRGSNDHDGYAKSKLFKYFAQLPSPIRWEKRRIKKQINDKRLGSDTYILKVNKVNKDNQNTSPIDVNMRQSWDDDGSFDYKYIRVLLGQAEQFEFQAEPKKLVVKIDGGEIDRFKSPITFKVYRGKLYLCASKIPEDLGIFNNTYHFSVKGRNGERKLESLKAPSSFDMDAFLDFALNDPDQPLENYTKIS